MELGKLELNGGSLSYMGVPCFKSDQDSIGLIGISFSTNVGVSQLLGSMGLHKLVMNGLGRKIEEKVI